MALKPVDSYYRSTWPSGWTNWHNHIHTVVENEFNSDWTKYADNEFYFFLSANSAGTNGEVMKTVNRYYAGGFQENHLYATTDAPPAAGSGYNSEGIAGYIYQNDGTNRTALYRFVKYYTPQSGYGQAQTSGTLVTNTTGVVKRVKLVGSTSSGVIACNNSSLGIFCYVENYRDTNTSSNSSGCSYPSSGYTNVGFSNITGSGSGLQLHIRITPVNGSGGNPNNMRVTYPGTWYNSGGGSFGEGGVYVSGGSGYAVGNYLNPVTSCSNMATGSGTAFQVTEVGTISTSQTVVNSYSRIDHRCGTTNINGIDGWIYEGIMGYVPYEKSGCTDPSATNYDAYANNDDGTCSYIVAPTTSITATNASNVTVSSIYKGQSVIITYSSTTGNGTLTTSFTATANGVATSPIATPGSSGAVTFSPIVQTTYKFAASNSVGSSDASVTVNVLNDDPVINFYTNKTNNTLNRGESITITWSATANQTITSTTMTGVLNPGVGGSVIITPSEPGTVTYTFTATNPSGTSVASLTVTTILLAPTASLTSSDADNTIIAGESVVLTWEALGFDITSYAMTGVLNPGAGGNITVSPTTTTTYTYTIINDSGTSSDSIVLTVYTPPTCTISVDDNPLIGGNSTTLRWITTGDADTIQWTQGGNISAANELSGNLSINPTNNKTYQARVSGLGGTADSNELELVVVYLPIIHTWNVPNYYDYGSTAPKTFEYNYQYVNNSATVTFVYVYKDVDGNDVFITQPNPISLPTSPGASGGGNDNRLSGTFTYVPTWTEFGPRSINVTIAVSGSGGSLTTTEPINIVIDELPNNINPEESPDKLANQIAYTPNDEDAVISDLYRIDDIDIPVEIKSDHKIQVRINNVDLWNNVREL